MDTILSKIENCKIMIPMIIIILMIIICIAICCWGSKPKRFREKCLCVPNIANVEDAYTYYKYDEYRYYLKEH